MLTLEIPMDRSSAKKLGVSENDMIERARSHFEDRLKSLRHPITREKVRATISKRGRALVLKIDIDEQHLPHVERHLR